MFKKIVLLCTALFACTQTQCGRKINRKIFLLEQRVEQEITSLHQAQETIIKILSKKEVSPKVCKDIIGFLDSYWISKKIIKNKLRTIRRKLNYVERKYLYTPSDKIEYKKYNEYFNKLYKKMIKLEKNRTFIIQLSEKHPDMQLLIREENLAPEKNTLKKRYSVINKFLVITTILLCAAIFLNPFIIILFNFYPLNAGIFDICFVLSLPYLAVQIYTYREHYTRLDRYGNQDSFILTENA